MSKEDTKFLKGIAIILLLYHHDPFYSDYGFFLQSGARVCVWLFIFISAYGFTLQMKEGYEKKPVRFVIKRILLLYAQMWFFYLFNLTMSIIWDPGLIGYFKSSYRCNSGFPAALLFGKMDFLVQYSDRYPGDTALSV